MLNGVTNYAAIVGIILSSLRKEKGLSQSEVAQHLDLNVSTWSRIENGLSALTVEQLAVVSECLGVTPSAILQLAETKAVELRDKGIETHAKALDGKAVNKLKPDALSIEGSTLANALGKISLLAVAALVSVKAFSEFKNK